VRRTDREVADTASILAILDRCEVMRIALCADNMPYIVPLNFAYKAVGEDVFIYFHCAREGKKLNLIAKNNAVCFEADCSCKILEAESACHWSAEYESVIGEGEITIVDDEDHKVKALDILMGRYGFIGTPRYLQQELDAVLVLMIHVSSMTGKRKIQANLRGGE